MSDDGRGGDRDDWSDLAPLLRRLRDQEHVYDCISYTPMIVESMKRRADGAIVVTAKNRSNTATNFHIVTQYSQQYSQPRHAAREEDETMGADIHSCVEVRVEDKWIIAPGCLVRYDFPRSNDFGFMEAEDWRIERNYVFFTVLAGVRPRFDIRPIAQPRGKPSDASAEANRFMSDGDHSHSYVTLAELLAYPDWGRHAAYSDLNDTHSDWTIRNTCGAFMKNILPKMERLLLCFEHDDCKTNDEMAARCAMRTPRDVRLVFCFDS